MNLDLKLTDEEKIEIATKVVQRQLDMETEWRVLVEKIARAIAEAATAKAVLFFKQGSCWCSYGGPMVGHSQQCETAQAYIEAAGISKPGVT